MQAQFAHTLIASISQQLELLKQLLGVPTAFPQALPPGYPPQHFPPVFPPQGFPQQPLQQPAQWQQQPQRQAPATPYPLQQQRQTLTAHEEAELAAHFGGDYVPQSALPPERPQAPSPQQAAMTERLMQQALGNAEFLSHLGNS